MKALQLLPGLSYHVRPLFMNCEQKVTLVKILVSNVPLGALYLVCVNFKVCALLF